MINLTHHRIGRIHHTLRSNALKGLFDPHHVLQELRNSGFSSCLYYDAAVNPATNDYQAVLSCFNDAKELTFPLGKRIDYRHCALGQVPHGSSDPVIQKANDEEQPSVSIKFAKELNIFDKNRVHIPIYHNDGLIGAITCVWTGNVDLVNSEALECLKTIGAIIAYAWALTNDNVVARLVHKIQDGLDQQVGPDAIRALLEQVARTTRTALEGKACAIFELNWYSGRVIKIVEDIPDYLGRDFLEEEYIVGRFLTGRAWADEKIRHIIDFEAYRSKYHHEVASPSLTFHQAVVGPVSTLLYDQLGTTQPRYLIRLINREDGHALPFLTSHRMILARIATEVGAILEDLIKRNHLRGLQDVATTAVKHVTNPRETFTLAATELKRENIQHITAVALDSRHEYISHILSTDPRIEQAFKETEAWEKDGFLSTTLNSTQETRAFELSKFDPANKSSSPLLDVWKTNKINLVIVLPLPSHFIKGCLFIPCPAETVSTPSELKRRLPVRHLQLLNAYAALIASCIESEEAHVTSENAKRLVAMIGHEVQGPVARLGQLAIEKLLMTSEAIEKFAGSHPDLKMPTSKHDLFRAQEELGQQMQQISILMDVAVDMAQEAKGVLQVHFQHYDLGELLKRAADEVSSTTPYTDANDIPVNYEFKFNDACKRFSPMVGDKDLLLKAFVNIFRNAVKYSLPPGRREPIIISVMGQPQHGNSTVLVKNFGIALPAEIREKVFQPFMRGDIKDRLKARRGMGLGLYIARRFISAHRGRVVCRDSKPTFDDPNRRDTEGWETTFEIKLPTGLLVGTFDDTAKP